MRREARQGSFLYLKNHEPDFLTTAFHISGGPNCREPFVARVVLAVTFTYPKLLKRLERINAFSMNLAICSLIGLL